MPRQNVWRIYFNPFDDNGLYSGWTEVSRDCVLDAIGGIAEGIDNTDFEIGIFRNADFSLTMRNDSGRYSDVDNPKSIFRNRRTGTQVKVTFELEDVGGPLIEMADIKDSWISEEIEVFKGILSDIGASEDLQRSTINFSVVGRETLLDNEEVPFSSLANGDLCSEALYTVLNRFLFTNLVTVSALNIVCETDQAIDDVASFEGKTCLEAVQDLLAASNSVLRIVDDVAYVSPRDEAVDVAAYFYGQGSSNGAENILQIQNIRTGIAKTFNYLFWSGTSTIVEDTASVAARGVRKKSIGYDFITNTVKRQAIMQSIVDEFKDPKQEFSLTTRATFEALEIELLDKVSIDYPVIYLPGNHPPGICGTALAGAWYTPSARWNFTVDPTDYFKVISKNIDIKAGTVTLGLRAV